MHGETIPRFPISSRRCEDFELLSSREHLDIQDIVFQSNMQFATFLVGDVSFSVPFASLNKFPDSVLALLAAKHQSQEVNIDRDAGLFRFVVAFIINGQSSINNGNVDRSALAKELQFYGLPIPTFCDTAAANRTMHFANKIIATYSNDFTHSPLACEYKNLHAGNIALNAIHRRLQFLHREKCKGATTSPTARTGQRSREQQPQHAITVSSKHFTFDGKKEKWITRTETWATPTMETIEKVAAGYFSYNSHNNPHYNQKRYVGFDHRCLKIACTAELMAWAHQEAQRVLPEQCTPLVQPHCIILDNAETPAEACIEHPFNEDRDGCIGKLILFLDSEYTGGELLISHDGTTEILGGARRWVVLYSDCMRYVVHSRPVESGLRVALVFDIKVPGLWCIDPTSTLVGAFASYVDKLVTAVRSALLTQPFVAIALQELYPLGKMVIPPTGHWIDQVLYQCLETQAQHFDITVVQVAVRESMVYNEWHNDHLPVAQARLLHALPGDRFGVNAAESVQPGLLLYPDYVEDPCMLRHCHSSEGQHGEGDQPDQYVRLVSALRLVPRVE